MAGDWTLGGFFFIASYQLRYGETGLTDIWDTPNPIDKNNTNNSKSHDTNCLILDS